MCSECLKSPCHPRCPNAPEPKASHYCSICDDGIYNGEKYIEDFDGDYIHWDCIYNKKDLAEWIGLDIKIMEE